MDKALASVRSAQLEYEARRADQLIGYLIPGKLADRLRRSLRLRARWASSCRRLVHHGAT